MDARKGMCYFAQYDKNGNCTKEPTLEVVDNLSLDIHTNKIITDAAMHNSLKERNIESICYTDINANLGKILGQLTYEKLKQNTTNHWAEAKPLYLQKPSITISKKNTLQ